MTAAVSAGAASVAQASVSRLVTEAPQCRAVARAELGEDPLVEDGRHEHDERQDLEERLAAGSGRRDAEGDERECRPLGRARVEAHSRNEPGQRERKCDRDASSDHGRRRCADRAWLACAPDEDREQRAEAERAQAERERRRHVAAVRGVVQGDPGQDERLNGQQCDGDGAPPNADDAEAEGDQHPGERAVHAIPTRWPAIPSKAATAPAARRRGTSRTRILTTRVSVSASAPHRTASQTGSSASCHHRPCGWGRKTWTASTSTSQWRGAAAPCRDAWSRPPYSSSGPSWIMVSSRWVSGLSTGWRPVSATTTSANATAPSPSAGLDQTAVPAVPAMMPV